MPRKSNKPVAVTVTVAVPPPTPTPTPAVNDPTNPTEDTILTPRQLARLLPGMGAEGHVHRATVKAWIGKGIRVKGKVLKLPCHRTPGGVRLIRWGDYLRWKRRVDEMRGVEVVEGDEEVETPTERKRRVKADMEECERLFAMIK